MTGLTKLLETYHDKLDEHTEAIAGVRTDIEALQASVKELEKQTATVDEASGARAGFRDWLKQLKDLL